MERMTKPNRAQLPLLELPAATSRPAGRARRTMSASMTARHCAALLAELDRVAEQQRRAQSLADLFDAAERAHAWGDDDAASGRRATG